jgi:hypothetical protein
MDRTDRAYPIGGSGIKRHVLGQRRSARAFLLGFPFVAAVGLAVCFATGDWPQLSVTF